jgi:hypothetical protein
MQRFIYPREHWTKHLQVGDVITNGGACRVVRKATHSASQFGRASYSFVIRHCSWTKRCYTVLTDNDLRQLGYRLIGRGFPLGTELDGKILEECESKSRPRIRCCDVSGLA